MPNMSVSDHLNLELSSVLSITSRTAAAFCDQSLDVAELVGMVDEGDPFTRKGLCEYLGIGESTLSGWIKDGRIPRMAKNACVLLVVQQMLADEVRRLQVQLDAAVSDLKVVRSGTHYQVCDLQEDEEGEIVGRVIADHITTLEDARLLASGRRALRVLKSAQSSGVFEYAREMSENQGFLSGVEALEEDIEAHDLFLSDYPRWKARFGKATRTRMLDDLLADKPEAEGDKS
jgi:hypothetical protein